MFHFESEPNGKGDRQTETRIRMHIIETAGANRRGKIPNKMNVVLAMNQNEMN